MHSEWSSWSEWGKCTVSCGGGQRRRFRTCNDPPLKSNARPCVGGGQETQTCNNQECAGRLLEDGMIYKYIAPAELF